MNDLEIIEKAINKKHPCDECHAALERIKRLINEAPKFFSIHRFDGEKVEWLKRAGLLEEF